MKKLLFILFISSVAYGQPMKVAAIQKHAGSSYDADAQAFIDAAGITDNTQKTAINNLVIAAKANSWWTLCNAIYPMVGGTATTHKYNLKDPRDLDAAFRLTFSGTWTHSANGADPDGTTAYADTHLNASTVLTANSTHLSYYSRENTTSGTDIGYYTNGDNANFQLLIRFVDGNLYTDAYDGSASRIFFSNSNSVGWFLSSRTSSTGFEVYQNGSSLSSNGGTVSGSLPNGTIYVGSVNTNTTQFFSDRQCEFATIGAGISSGLAATMNTDIQAFQTALGR